jgi:hypothetical protein
MHRAIGVCWRQFPVSYRPVMPKSEGPNLKAEKLLA